MSQEDVDRMREGIEAMNHRDIDAVVRGMHPEVRFEHRLAALQGSFIGVDGVRRWFADLVEHFGTWRISCEDIRDLGDRVLALGTIRATGRESGVETEFPLSCPGPSRSSAWRLAAISLCKSPSTTKPAICSSQSVRRESEWLTHRKPMWLVDVSIASAWRAAGR